MGGTVPAFSDPRHILVLVAGDFAGYAVVWGTPVGSTVTLGDNQGLPDLLFMTRKIRGATLTKSGR